VPVFLDAGGVEGPISPALLSCVSLLSPNETELARLTGMSTEEDAQVSNIEKGAGLTGQAHGQIGQLVAIYAMYRPRLLNLNQCFTAVCNTTEAMYGVDWVWGSCNDAIEVCFVRACKHATLKLCAVVRGCARLSCAFLSLVS
jgi:hypothetical protein